MKCTITSRRRCTWKPRHSCRSQAGYTLTEVLLVVVLMGMILSPLFAWMLLAMRQQPITKDGLIRTAHTGLLSSYFPQDVAVAGAAWIPGQTFQGDPSLKGDWEELNTNDCIGGGGSNGRSLVMLWSGGGNTVKTVYSMAAGSSGKSGAQSVWRRLCDADTGELVSSIELFENVETGVVSGQPSVYLTRGTCFSDVGDLPCRQVQIIVTPTTQNEPAKISAMRRTDAESLRIDSSGNQIPTVRIQVVSNDQVAAGSQARQLVLKADASDVDGRIVAFEWTLPNGSVGTPDPATVISGELADGVQVPDQTHILPRAGAYSIQVTVTDDSGASRSTYHQVIVENRRPVVSMDVAVTQPSFDPDGNLLSGSLEMSSAGSHDPDGSIVSYQWELTEPDVEDGQDPDLKQPDQNAGPKLTLVLTGPTATFEVPEWLRGQIVVTLQATDNDGATAQAIQTVTIIDPTSPTDPDPETPDPVAVGEPPVAVLVAVRHNNSREWTFDGSRSGVDPQAGELQFAWQVNGSPIAATTEKVSHVFAVSGPATVTLTVTDTHSRTDSVTQNITVPETPVVFVPPQEVWYNLDENRLYWHPVPGARRYLVDFRVVANGCQRGVLNQAVSASINYKAVPENPCPGNAVASARVGAEFTPGGEVYYSAWYNLGEIGK